MEKTLRSLYYFTVVAQTLSFTNAAKALYISQQALSKHVQRLEAQYGTTFFERAPTLRLTPDGRRMLNYALRLLEEDESLRRAFEKREYSESRFPLGMATDCCDILVPELYPRLREQMPHTVLGFSTVGYGDAAFLVKRGSIRAYFGMLHAIDTTDERMPLFRDELCFVMSRSLYRKQSDEVRALLRQGVTEGLSVEDIAWSRLPLIMPWFASRMGRLLQSALLEHDATKNVVAEAVNSTQFLALCKMDVGGAYMFRSQMYRRLSSTAEPPYVFPLRDMDKDFTLGMVYPKDSENDPMMAILLDCVKPAAEAAERELHDRLLAYRSEQLASMT